MAERVWPAPATTVEGKEFWAAAAQGKFMLRGCATCGKLHWYPRAICPFCSSDANEWHEASGKGTIYTYTVMRQVPEPYAIAYVTLDEGPSMLTNIVGVDFGDLAIGKRVKLVLTPTENGPPLPLFTLE